MRLYVCFIARDRELRADEANQRKQRRMSRDDIELDARCSAMYFMSSNREMYKDKDSL